MPIEVPIIVHLHLKASMSLDKGKLHLQLPVGQSEVSLISAISDTETIRPLISPVQSDPDQPTAPTTLDKLLSSPGDEEDDMLLKSLKSMSFLNNKYIENANESRVSLRYQDEPNKPGEVAEPFIFNPNDSRVVRTSRNNTTTNLLDSSPVVSRTRSHSITESIVTEIIHLKEFTVAQLKRRRFIVVGIFSIICIFIFNLIFLPRTSLDRDLRRLYRGFMTYDDVARIFINQLYYRPKCEEYLNEYALRNHFTGTGFEYEYSILESFPYISTTKEQFDVFVGTPQDVAVGVTDKGREVYKATNVAYIPYSPSTNVEARYVYVNYGSDDDYKTLVETGVNIKGYVFIVRIHDIHPSVIIKRAQEEGAAAVILYRDPYDDNVAVRNGYAPFPKGPARSPNGIESSTGSFIFEQPGDPTTPGWSPYLFDHKKRLHDPESIPKIPIAFVSFTDAERILQDIDGEGEGEKFGWEGDLKYDYSVGPSGENIKINIVNDVEYGIKPITNIVTRIPGIMSDEEIIIGASGDSNAYTGGVSNSAVTLLEIARGFNELARRGWKPLRTVKLVLWDGSSAGVIGSTEHGEYYEQNIVDSCLVYINLDRISGSKLHVESNPMFVNVVERVMKMILVNGTTPLESNLTHVSGVLDYSIFQYHLGIPSINIGYESAGVDPVTYTNSGYDNLEFLRKFDPSVRLHSVQAQFAGLLALELSEREMIEGSVKNYIDVLRSAVSDVLGNIPSEWVDRNMTYPFQYEKMSNEIDLVKKVNTALAELSEAFDENADSLRADMIQDYPWFKIYKKFKTAFAVKRINLKMKAVDKLFMSEYGWFRHILFTPSGVLLSGLLEAISKNDFDTFAKEFVTLRLAMQRVERLL